VKASVAARRALTAAVAAHAREVLFLSLDNNVDCVLLEASCGAGARAWADGASAADGQHDFAETRESGGRLLPRDSAGAGAGSTARRRMR
jgi:hypothetical protein